MRGRRFAYPSGAAAWPVRDAVTLAPDRLRKLSHFIGWVYQVLLWSVLIFGTYHAASSRLLRLEAERYAPPVPTLDDPTRRAAYTIR